MINNKNVKEYECVFCENNDFEVSEDIIAEIKKENVVIFAGAGISTEGRGIYKSTLYSEVNDELCENNDKTFPKLMAEYCNRPNGRRYLINKIIKRFEYYKSFPEIDNMMKLFFEPLADIYSIKEIITTNWDRQFEEKCNCMPVVYDADISLLDEKRRKVYKIHGSIDNIGTLVMTDRDYEICYNKLRENLIGGRIKELLSRKTVIFIGYSLEDEDFKKIWQFIDDKLNELKPHFYIVTPDKKMEEKLKDRNVTVINTLGSNFMEKIKQILIKDKFLLNSDIFYVLTQSILSFVLEVHERTTKLMQDEKNPLLIYSTSFQDGIIHSLQRIVARKNTGEYLKPKFLLDSICTYYEMSDDYLKSNNLFDATYVMGYAYAMQFMLESYNDVVNDKNIEKCSLICLYYLPKKTMYNNFKKFKEALNKYKNKKYINIANEVLKRFDNENCQQIIHHIPFL